MAYNTFTSFVSENYLKGFTPISKNIDVEEVVAFLEEVELMDVREIIGKPLYDDIKTKFINQTLNTNEIELVNLLKRGIAYKSASQALPFLNTKITSKGVQKLRGEFSEAGSMEEMKYLRRELENKSEYFFERVVEYLCKNSKYFPLYNTSDDVEGIVSTSESRYDSDIYIEDYDNLRIKRYLYGPNQNQ